MFCWIQMFRRKHHTSLPTQGHLHEGVAHHHAQRSWQGSSSRGQYLRRSVLDITRYYLSWTGAYLTSTESVSHPCLSIDASYCMFLFCRHPLKLPVTSFCSHFPRTQNICFNQTNMLCSSFHMLACHQISLIWRPPPPRCSRRRNCLMRRSYVTTSHNCDVCVCFSVRRWNFWHRNSRRLVICELCHSFPFLRKQWPWRTFILFLLLSPSNNLQEYRH